MYLLRDSLLTNRTISELILRNCRLTDQAAIALAEYIAESSSIQHIDLRENNIQISGICGLAIAMKTNQSLFKLDFDPMYSAGGGGGLTNSIIDRTAPTASLLSLANLRKMTGNFGGLTGGVSNSSNGLSDHDAQELMEQKMKWMNDIQCICQRNLLVHEEEQRNHSIMENNGTRSNRLIFLFITYLHLEELPLFNGIEQPESVIIEEQSPSEDTIQNHREETVVLSDQISENVLEDMEQPFDTSDKDDHPIEELNNGTTNENDEIEQIPNDSFE